MEDADQPVEDVLVLRVVSEAHRRRARRAVVAGLLVIIASGGAAIGLTHRSGAEPTARPAPPSRSTPLGTTAPPADLAAGNATRADILAVARVHYASARQSGSEGKTHLEFGRLTVTGSRATLQVNFVCMGLCGHGEELILAKRHAAWRVVGVRQTWMS
jgi:hypothetical protein